LTALPTACVVDACVGVALAFEESLSGKAQRLFDAATDDLCACHVHELYYLECASAARKRSLRLGMSREETELRFSLLLGQPLHLHAVAGVAPQVLSRSLGLGISVYDASYSVLASELGVPVVSADLRLVRALRAAGESAIYLGDLDG
jgi:predicted nucleic acid-binding protein